MYSKKLNELPETKWSLHILSCLEGFQCLLLRWRRITASVHALFWTGLLSMSGKRKNFNPSFDLNRFLQQQQLRTMIIRL